MFLKKNKTKNNHLSKYVHHRTKVGADDEMFDHPAHAHGNCQRITISGVRNIFWLEPQSKSDHVEQQYRRVHQIPSVPKKHFHFPFYPSRFGGDELQWGAINNEFKKKRRIL